MPMGLDGGERNFTLVIPFFFGNKNPAAICGGQCGKNIMALLTTPIKTTTARNKGLVRGY